MICIFLPFFSFQQTIVSPIAGMSMIFPVVLLLAGSAYSPFRSPSTNNWRTTALCKPPPYPISPLWKDAMGRRLGYRIHRR
jgi:hypothetical protein